MKRIEALAPLSRDHHKALILAQLLKSNVPDYKGLPTKNEDKIKYALELYESEIKDHFIKEEVILERVKDIHPEILRLAEEIINEHNQLRSLFKSLHLSEDAGHTMNILGNLLHDHIRKEERVLFPLLQDHCPDDLLGAIDDLLH